MVTAKVKTIILLLLVLFGNVSIMLAETVENLEYFIQNKQCGLRDKSSKKIIVPCEFDYIGSYVLGLAPVKIKEKWGFIDRSGKIVIPAKYQGAYAFSEKEGLAAIKVNGKWGFINKNGVIKINPKYDSANSFGNNQALVSMNDKKGVINTLGKVVIPIEYEDLSYRRKGGFYDAKLNGKWGVINSTNVTIIPFVYENQLYYDEDDIVCRCQRNGKWGLVNNKGREILECDNEQVSNPYEGLVAVNHNGKHGYVDYEGKIIMPFIWAGAEDFKNGISIIKDDNTDFCLISIDSRRIKTFESGSLSEVNYVDGNFYVHHKSTSNGYKEALLDKDGNPITQYIYDDIKIFHGSGLIGAMKNDKWGFINLNGDLIIPCQFDEIAYHFEGGCIPVKQNNKWGLINTDGKYITSNCFDEIYITEKFSKVRIGDKWGAVNNLGKELIPVKYEEVGWPNLTYQYFPVKLNGTDGYVDFYGNDTF